MNEAMETDYFIPFLFLDGHGIAFLLILYLTSCFKVLIFLTEIIIKYNIKFLVHFVYRRKLLSKLCF